MIRKSDIQIVVQSQYKNLAIKRKLINREISSTLNINSPLANIITGIRRCGKSTFLRQLMQDQQKLNYISFEDIRLSSFETEDFEKLDEVFNENSADSSFYFFDEIQNIPRWELFVRQKLDEGKRIIITGSNASLLSRELGTRLTGRHLDLEMFPFSYQEFLDFTEKDQTMKSFSDYLTLGGFPEYLQLYDNEILSNLLSDILVRDIAVRYGIRNTRVLKELAVYLLSNLGKPFSFQSLRKIFNLGATSTIIDYISFFEDSFLLFTIPKFDYSLKKQSYNPKKAYAIDNGLASVNSFSFSADNGRLLENLVFIGLRKKYKEIFYFRQKYECDFVIKDRGNMILAIQVCYHLSSDNKSREFNGLIEAMQFFNLPIGFILTMDEEDLMTVDGRQIILKPVWKWLME